MNHFPCLETRININKNRLAKDAASKSVGNGRVLLSKRWRIIILTGFGIGLLGGLVGLGSIRIPAMISVLRMEPRVAMGTRPWGYKDSGLRIDRTYQRNNIGYGVLIITGSSTMVGEYLDPSL
jgi:hypothetical protein